MFKVEAVVNGDQLETLLLAAKAAGVTLALGVVPAEVPQRRAYKSRGAKRSTKKRKQKYPAKMLVKIGDKSKLTTALMGHYQTLERKYGSSPFEKRHAKGVLKVRGGSAVSEMIRRGGLVAATA